MTSPNCSFLTDRSLSQKCLLTTLAGLAAGDEVLVNHQFLQAQLIETGERLVGHARSRLFQLAEVLVIRDMLRGILERISRLRVAPG